MELREIIKKIKKNRKIVITSILGGLLLGILFYTLPSRYISSGSLYVKRSIEPSEVFFTYEGYYAQQSAQSYTNSFVALVESPDIQKKTLESIGTPITDKNLRKLNRLVKVKKMGPQVISVKVIDKDYDYSEKVWVALTKSVIETSKELNESGDKNISVSTISEKPLVEETYKSIYLYSLAGTMLGLSIGCLYICIKEYIKE